MIPEVSIITCNFNHAKYLERCIRSVKNQINIDSNEIEHIIVDDASTDESRYILEKYDELKVVYNENNLGLPSSLNKALRLAKGRFIVRLDSDDYLARTFVYIHKMFLQYNTHFDAVCSDYFLVSDGEENFDRRFAINDFIACGIFYRKEVLFDLGLYNEEFKFREGHELNERFEKNGYLKGFSGFPLYKYRMHDNNRSNSHEISEYDKKLKRNIK
jgi:glycosyltransferase involved in cell wall biosynthesis